LTDEAKVHLPARLQHQCCQPTEIKSHKTSQTIPPHNCSLFTRVVRSLPPSPSLRRHTRAQRTQRPVCCMYRVYGWGKRLRAGRATEVDFRLRSGFLVFATVAPPSLPMGTGGVRFANVKLATHPHTLQLASSCDAPQTRRKLMPTRVFVLSYSSTH
jgi:hypothetical protein